MKGFCRQFCHYLLGKTLKVLPALALLFSLVAINFSAHAAEGITSLRIGQGVGNVRIVLDSDSSFAYKVFLLNNFLVNDLFLPFFKKLKAFVVAAHNPAVKPKCGS